MRNIILVVVLVLMGCTAVDHHIAFAPSVEDSAVGAPITVKCERCKRSFVFPDGVGGPAYEVPRRD